MLVLEIFFLVFHPVKIKEIEIVNNVMCFKCF